uniref:Putative ribonuclease H-like domain-containing protein n=1 Tax=Helianthus annuus TaxID=4232 RepID=A0A251S5C6_HELAN
MMASVEVWHKRLGHTSNDKLSCFDFVENASFKTMDCDSCAKAKHTRLPFPVSSIKSKECFELLHCDIWGRYRTPSFSSGANYFLTIVDDYSRSVWVFLLKHKYEAGDRLMYFHKLVKTQFGKMIKRIRCDNGGEFVSNRMNDFYAEQGIILETTCPHMPQQNGIVEIKHRHLLETARALRFEANLPKKFWGECVMTAAYIINRLPSKTIDNKTPFEILFEEKPEYEHMKVFGCLAYFRNTDTKGDKFEWKGKPGVFLGYPPGTKGYKIYDMVHNKMVVSRDVRFVENNFPYRNLDPIDKQENKRLFDFLPWYYEGIDKPTPNQTGGPNTEDMCTNRPFLQDLDSNIQFDNENGAQDNESATLDDGPDGHPQQTNQTENSIQEEESNVGPQLDKPQRVRTQPKRLNDFIVNLPPSIDHALPSSDQQSSTAV